MCDDRWSVPSRCQADAKRIKSDPDALFFFSPLKKPNGKSKVVRFDANKYFPMAEGPDWDTHIGTRARILKAIAKEDRRSDQDAKEAMFDALAHHRRLLPAALAAPSLLLQTPRRTPHARPVANGVGGGRLCQQL
eukprot:SAG25_NODE_160_length_13390_cov_9.002708_18_plen_135_part_00